MNTLLRTATLAAALAISATTANASGNGAQANAQLAAQISCIPNAAPCVKSGRPSCKIVTVKDGGGRIRRVRVCSY